MKLIVGLGNPGDNYRNNRHNIGFMFVDYLATNSNVIARNTSDEAISFKYDKYLLSDVAKSDELIFAKPHTFMNKSGDAVKKLTDKYLTTNYQLLTTELIIIHDDLDIPFGKFKIQNQGPKAHNGLTDIQNKLQTMDFLRIRIGVDARPSENRMNGEEYVLQDFTKEELSQLPELFKKAEERFNEYLHINK